MKKQYIFVGIVIVVICSGLSGCLEPRATEYFNEEYEANENTVLKVSTLNGQIEINPWDGDTITINAIKKSVFGQEELDNVEINIIESENQFEIEVSGTKGDIIATSSNGAIVIENVDGYVSATTSNGRIEIKGTTGIKDLKSSNLGINVEVYDFKENVSISTSNGGITIYINPSLNADIDMTTSNGQISISDISLNLTISEEKHKFGKLGEGGNKLNILTSNGNINLYKLDM
jgi:hypothetical protein